MSKPTFHIRFLGETTPIYIHRVRNCAEDLQREIVRKGYGSLGDIDSATDSITVTLTKRQQYATAQAVIEKTLVLHHFFDDTEITANRR